MNFMPYLSNPAWPLRRAFILSLLGLHTLLVSLAAPAQTATTATISNPPASGAINAGTTLQLQGMTLDQRPFDIRQLRGKVTLIAVWRTDCAVCREQMRELRDNTKGWGDKPFATVLVNSDARLADIQAYNSFIQQLLPVTERLSQLWLYEPQFKDNFGLQQLQSGKTPTNLPVFFIVNQRGELVERHEGRLPAAAWERIAFLL